MDLSAEISKGLSLVGDAKQIPEQAFKPLLEFAFAIPLRKATEQNLQEHSILSKLDAILVKQAYAALVSFFLEAAKRNSDPSVLKAKLDELNVEAKRSELMIQFYSEHKNGLRELLASTGFGWPHVVGVDWRLDYYIKSNTLEKADAPLFYISLKTKVNRELGSTVSQDEGGESGHSSGLENVSFTCTVEQLQDLVAKLRDAVKQVERSSNLQ